MASETASLRPVLRGYARSDWSGPGHCEEPAFGPEAQARREPAEGDEAISY